MSINRRWHRADLIVTPLQTLVVIGVLLAIVVLSAVAS